MSPCSSDSKLAYCRCVSRYETQSLHQLISIIGKIGDRQALNEFHIRPFFIFRGENALTCTEYIDRCRKELSYSGRGAPNSYEIADRAYDLTIDKFSNLPTGPGHFNKIGACKNNLKRDGPNCRFYFKAVLNGLNKSFKKNPYLGQLELESRTAAAVQGLVLRHFHLSVLEVVRKINPLWSRYYWDMGDRKICLRLPVHLKGVERRKWLEKNIDILDPAKTYERKRIQAQIYSLLGNVRILSFNEAVHGKVIETHEHYLCRNVDICRSLGEIVAEEKADHIEKQRRAIRALRKDKLKRLIKYIFQNIGCEDYKDNEIADSYGLSKATFSRFAGSHWNNSDSSIPDLWLNTAQVLSIHPDFKDVAVDAGVWDQVAKTIEKLGAQKNVIISTIR